MKYRYITQVMTRHSGMMSIFCRDLDQAMENVEMYSKKVQGDFLVISFDSISALPNVFLISEIIAVSITDMEVQRDIALEEAKEHHELHRDIEFNQGENDGGYG